jgi:hypothetical protein
MLKNEGDMSQRPFPFLSKDIELNNTPEPDFAPVK